MPIRQTLVTVALILFTATTAVGQQGITWVTDLAKAKQLAERHQRLVLVHFWDHNCAPCEMLERRVFNQPEFIRAVNTNYVPVKINVSAARDVAEQYNISRWPTDVVIDAAGREIFRAVSPQDSNRYIATLDQIAAHARVGMTNPGMGPSSDPLKENRATAFVPSSASRHGLGNPASAPPQGQAISNQFAVAGQGSTPPRQAAASGPYYGNQFAASNSQGAAASTGPSIELEAPQIPRGLDPKSGNQFSAQPPPTAAPIINPNRATVQTNRFAPSHSSPPPAASAPPAGDPAPMDLDGYCPVALNEQHVWTKGNPQWGAIHRGRTYLFIGPEEQKRFLASPDRFAPVLSGQDPVLFIEQSVQVAGRRQHGVFFNGTVYLFANEDNLKQFWGDPNRYAQEVARAMNAARQ